MASRAAALPAFALPPPERSGNMRAITSRRNRTTELRLRALLIRAGLQGWSLHPPGGIGSPDFVFRQRKVAVFVDGCFWHGCPRCGHVPKTNATYWRAKIERNRRRDRAMSRAARNRGYRVVRVWECALRDRPGYCLERIQRAVRGLDA